MRDDRTTAEPIRLYYWPSPNFGDQLSHDVVAHVSGRAVVQKGPRQAELFAIGSLLQGLCNNFKSVPDGTPRPLVWGAGMMRPVMRREFLDNVDIRLLRGPVSAAILDLPMTAFGDPGLLAPEAMGPPPDRQDRIVVIPHHAQMEDGRFEAMVARDLALHLVDPRQSPATVCAAIASAAHVFSASLHGLIVADAYGVPNTWIDPGGHARLKYYDYAASIGRDLQAPVALDAVPGLAARAATGTLCYTAGIARARASLWESFPAELRAPADAEVGA